MFTKKDRKIANQKAMIERRDKKIEEQHNEIIALKNLISRMKVLASSNLYGTDGTPYLRKINELADLRNSH